MNEKQRPKIEETITLEEFKKQRENVVDMQIKALQEKELEKTVGLSREKALNKKNNI